MKKINIEFPKEHTYQRNIIISNCDLDITQIYFTVKEKPNSKYIAIQKKIGAGIELMDIDSNNKTYQLTITPDDTEKLKTDYNYGYDITIRGGQNNFYKDTLVIGSFKLLSIYTTKKEENNEWN